MAREPSRPRCFSLLRARAFAARLDVDPWAAGICLPCLSFVVFPLDNGDEREALTWMRRMTPDLWAEGLEEYASTVVRALVLRLAEVEVERLRAERRVRGSTWPLVLRGPPEPN